VSKRKDSIALFEVISKAKQEGTEPKTTVPAWATRDATGRAEPPVGPQAEGEAPPAQATAPAQPAASESPARRSIFDIAPSAERTIVRDGGRMKISLSYLHWGGVAAALVAVLIVVFLVGRASVGGGPGPIPGATPGAGGAGQVGKTDGQAGKTGGQVPPAARGRQVGKYYLVIQGNLTSQDEGARISEFCAGLGEPSTVARYRSSDKYFVWSMTPFDSPEIESAQAYAKKIEELGKKYFAAHKTYDFRQTAKGPDGKSKFQPTFLQYNG